MDVTYQRCCGLDVVGQLPDGQVLLARPPLQLPILALRHRPLVARRMCSQAPVKHSRDHTTIASNLPSTLN